MGGSVARPRHRAADVADLRRRAGRPGGAGADRGGWRAGRRDRADRRAGAETPPHGARDDHRAHRPADPRRPGHAVALPRAAAFAHRTFAWAAAGVCRDLPARRGVGARDDGGGPLAQDDRQCARAAVRGDDDGGPARVPGRQPVFRRRAAEVDVYARRDDGDLSARPGTVRVTQARKRDTDRQRYVGPPKTKRARRTVYLPDGLVDVLLPLVAGKAPDELGP